MRLIVAVPLLLLFLWAQRYWFLRLWRFANRIESRVLRPIVHGLTVFGFGLVAAALLALFFSGRRDLVWRFSGMMGVVGLWITTAFLSWVVISLVSGIRLIGRRARSLLVRAPDAAGPAAHSPSRLPSTLQDDVRLDRRQFVQAATALAGAIPFGAGAYGFLIGRHDYRVHQLDLRVSGLPREIDGLRIAPLSDLHIGRYTYPAGVRRAAGRGKQLQ